MRAAGILVFCLFSSILSTVTSLKCQTCLARGTECEGEAVKVVECKEDEDLCSTQVHKTNIITSQIFLTCAALGTECEKYDTKAKCKEDEEFCSTVVANTTITNTSVSFIIKECSKRERCLTGVYTTSTVDGRFEVTKGNCCETDVCNAEPLLLENHDELQPNGLQCPGCYALHEDSCEAHQTVNCVGDEDQCFNISNTIKTFGNFTEKITYQGCTKQNSCSFPQGFSEVSGGLMQFNVTNLECRNASSSKPDHQ
ncbi:phospholipase A2 inhibitor gamma subunit B-like [Ahaetulla prasina]|uniref:phospholipase A2 inhibitor gamma subunit B-like n=1 Tax=Ahaetulla prasina TaxID=499056 RepID=UPI002647CC79|nr:phospholipase A2 inhibitor gamma subunit B-like [Ahaetulla prasina]